MRLSVVVAEAALELVPIEIQKTHAVRNDAGRRGVEPSRMLLDRSFHHSAMAGLRDSHKRGRPDLVHMTLLSLTSSPLYADGGLKVFVHTYNDLVLEVKEKTRLPKNYLRFRGLMEKVLVSVDGEGLIKTHRATFKQLVRMIQPDWVCGMSIQGVPTRLDELRKTLVAKRSPCVVIGGFPHGHFSSHILEELDSLVRIDSRPLDAHVVAARLVYEVERQVRQGDDAWLTGLGQSS